jgi:type IV fimbrial biogenesis protein FimT
MLTELIVTLTVIGLLLMAAGPAMSSWTANAQVRTVADALQDGLRLAQAEAARRNRLVQFVLTDSDPLGNGPWTASTTGKNWVVLTVPVTALIDPLTGVAEVSQLVQGNTLAGVAGLVAVQGPATLTFNSVGFVSGSTGTSTYQISRSQADHPINVTVSIGGQVRACDSSKLIANSPEGC